MKPEEREQLFRDGFEAYAVGDIDRAVDYFEITLSFERALEIAHEREVSN